MKNWRLERLAQGYNALMPYNYYWNLWLSYLYPLIMIIFLIYFKWRLITMLWWFLPYIVIILRHTFLILFSCFIISKGFKKKSISNFMLKITKHTRSIHISSKQMKKLLIFYHICSFSLHTQTLFFPETFECRLWRWWWHFIPECFSMHFPGGRTFFQITYNIITIPSS